MNQSLVALGLALSLPSLHAADDPHEKSKAARQALQGTWRVVKAETGLGPSKASEGQTFTFTGDRLVMTTSRGGQIKATFDLDAAPAPARLTYRIKDEAGEDVLNHVIHELDGGRLKIAGIWNARAGVSRPFPREFKVDPGDEESYVLVLEKVTGAK